MQEFLNVMRPKSKTKSWANGEGVDGPSVQQTSEDASVPVVIAEEASDDEYETVPKKMKVRTTPERQTSTATETQVSNKSLPEQPEQSASAPAISDEPSAEQAESSQRAVSDADWARSKTSRLLGLLDDDEEAEAAAATKPATAEPESRNEMLQNDNFADRNHEEHSEARDSGEQDAPPTANDDDSDSKPVDTDIETARKTMRLFVRNLPYDVTSEALEAEFAPYGNLEEVRACLSFFCVPLPSTG
jgi:multiple RNA-binding domain-containing protein 1